MTFYATEIDACPAYGWVGGPTIDILIRQLRNKHERRNWFDGVILHSFTLPFSNIRDDDYLQYIKSAFMAMHGPHNSFLCKDWGDFNHGLNAQSLPMSFAVGDGSTGSFQLSKTYAFGSAVFVRPITKPVVSTLRFFLDDSAGSEVFPDVDPLTGEVNFSTADAPDTGLIVSWTGEFRVPVRFSDFTLPATIDDRIGDERFATNGSCTLQEVIGE